MQIICIILKIRQAPKKCHHTPIKHICFDWIYMSNDNMTAFLSTKSFILFTLSIIFELNSDFCVLCMPQPFKVNEHSLYGRLFES